MEVSSNKHVLLARIIQILCRPLLFSEKVLQSGIYSPSSGGGEEGGGVQAKLRNFTVSRHLFLK